VTAAAFHVYLERPRDPTASGRARLAAAIAARYGLPEDDLAARLAAGRFRVKAGVDRGTAERFAADLEQLGADCTVVDGRTGAPVVRVPTSIPPRPAPQSFHSGLAAAFEARQDEPDLGALGEESGTLSLATLDGSDDAAAHAAARFAPPPAARPSIPALPAPVPTSPAFGAGPVDLFAPPEDEAPLDLAMELAEVPKKSGTVAPEPVAPPVAPPSPAPVRVTAAPAAGGAPTSLPDRVRRLAESARARFAAGVFLAVLLGFVPAHVIASVREGAAFAAIDATVAEQQARVSSLEDWQGLDRVRAAQLDRKRTERRSIALFSLLVWAAAGGGIAFAWFRVLDPKLRAA